MFSIDFRNFHLDRDRRFVSEFSVESCFRGYLGEIESKRKILEIFGYLFLTHVQSCVRASASIFPVLTRKSGGARAFGNIVRFLACPARRPATFHGIISFGAQRGIVMELYLV